MMNDHRAEALLRSPDEDQEIDLIDVLDFLRRNFVTIATCTLLSITCALATFAVLPYKWKSSVTLQVGKIPLLGKIDFLEPPVEVVEKIRSPLFLSKMVSLMYGTDVAPDSPTAQLLYRDLKVSMVKDSSLVTVQVFGWTAEQSYKNAGLLATSIISEYRTASEPYLAATKKRLSEVMADIARDREVLRKAETTEQHRAAPSAANTLLRLALIDAKASEIEKLQTERARLESLLSAAQAQDTKIVGRSLVPRRPASPKLGLLLVGGALVGLLLGLLVSFGLTLRRRMAQNSSGS